MKVRSAYPWTISKSSRGDNVDFLKFCMCIATWKAAGIDN